MTTALLDAEQIDLVMVGGTLRRSINAVRRAAHRAEPAGPARRAGVPLRRGRHRRARPDHAERLRRGHRHGAGRRRPSRWSCWPTTPRSAATPCARPCPPTRIDLLVTDQQADRPTLQALVAAGVEVLVADSDLRCSDRTYRPLTSQWQSSDYPPTILTTSRSDQILAACDRCGRASTRRRRMRPQPDPPAKGAPPMSPLHVPADRTGQLAVTAAILLLAVGACAQPCRGPGAAARRERRRTAGPVDHRRRQRRAPPRPTTAACRSSI